ncbi:MAG: RNA-splicing ligase RtcB [Thiobacillus sp. SCN 63-1177]|nr:MAG: RNA-splicing ligase RtcB [Thiobacillus sp. SCN 63-1177]
MNLALFKQVSDVEWRVAPFGKMRVPAVVYADQALVREMDEKVFAQLVNVATLPGIVDAAYAMPDAHWGYGFPIGGVAAFDADAGGVVSAGGVGFDISCGVRQRLAERLFARIPAGLGSTGQLRLDAGEMDAMLRGGARWAVERGYGSEADLDRIEERGCMAGAEPGNVSEHAKRRQRDEIGTLGSGNHYLELQEIAEIYDSKAADRFRLRQGEVVVSIHCGSRGLGHQIGTEFLRQMVIAAPGHGIELPDRELACAPILSPLGQAYLGAMRAAVNCALANRQVITQLARKVFADIVPGTHLTLIYDVSHNTCKQETHTVGGQTRRLYVHRKGATRAFGPGHPALPGELRDIGQPVLIGGSMGTASYILAGTETGVTRAFSSACHGAGRAMSRHQAARQWHGRTLVDELAGRGILIRSPSLRGVAEEAPGAYKDVSAVVEAADRAGLARKVAKLKPLVCIKG